MKNLILASVRAIIPYVKELKPLAGTTNACLLMQQIDYWFARHPNGFYKYLEPCDTPRYRMGSSWTEELAFTPDEFRSAFDRIGIRYTSKTAYDEAEDKFGGKFYCSYFNKREGVTYYFRNHDLADQAIANALNCSPELLGNFPGAVYSHPSVDGYSRFPSKTKPIPVDGYSHPEYKEAETTEETKKDSVCKESEYSEKGIGKPMNPEEDDSDPIGDLVWAKEAAEQKRSGSPELREAFASLLTETPEFGKTIPSPVGDLARTDIVPLEIRELVTAFLEGKYGKAMRFDLKHWEKYDEQYAELKQRGYSAEQIRTVTNLASRGPGAYSSLTMVTPRAIAESFEDWLAGAQSKGKEAAPVDVEKKYRSF